MNGYRKVLALCAAVTAMFALGTATLGLVFPSVARTGLLAGVDVLVIPVCVPTVLWALGRWVP